MANNGPIIVTPKGVTVSNAVNSKLIFNTRYPFALIDSTKRTSYQVTRIIFSKDVPNPPFPPNIGVYQTAQQTTKVYSFAHGYKYRPAALFLLAMDNFQSVIGAPEQWFVGDGFTRPLFGAYFFVTVDATNVNFYVTKYVSTETDGSTYSCDVTGMSLYVRSYIFASDVLGGEVPTQA